MLELPFWLTLLYWSLVPSTQTLLLEIGSVPINSKDIILVVVSCLYLLLATINNPKKDFASRPRNWHCYLPIVTFILLIYAAFTMLFYAEVLPQGIGDIHPMEDRLALAMRFTLIFTASSCFLGYIIIAKKTPEAVHSFLWRLTVCLAGIGILYCAVTFLGVNLGDVRSDIVSAQDVHGILRVVGPLFGAANGFFILVPALAFSVQEFFRDRTQRLFKLSIIFSLMLTIIGLGSRAALVILGLFFIFLSFSMKNKKQSIATIMLLIIVILAVGGLVFNQTNTERLNSFEDSGRSDTHLISFKIIAHRDLEFNIVGSGYGSYWSWYLTNNEMNLNTDMSMASTRFGKMLYHPHSVFLLLIVELGIFGLLYFVYLWIILGRLLINRSKSAAFPIFYCGVFASGFSMFFNFFIFKSQPINTIWWIYLFGALSLRYSKFSGKLQFNTQQQQDELSKLPEK